MRANSSPRWTLAGPQSGQYTVLLSHVALSGTSGLLFLASAGSEQTEEPDRRRNDGTPLWVEINSNAGHVGAVCHYHPVSAERSI